MNPERRKSTRIKKALDLQYLTEVYKEAETWVGGLLRDISETGMSFTSDKSFLPGQIICVRIRFPFNPFQWVELKGRCIDSKGLSIGIYIIRLEFEDLLEEPKKTVKDYLAWVLQKEQKDNG